MKMKDLSAFPAKEEMTSLERTTAYWAGKAVDRLPFSMDLGESIVPYFGYSNREYLFSAEIMVEVEERVQQEFGGDGMGFSINTRAFGEAFGSQMIYPDYGYSSILSHHCAKGKWITEMESIDPYRDGRLPIILEATKRLQEKYGKEQPLSISLPCPGNCALSLVGITDLLKMMLKEPDRFNQLMDFCLASVRRCAEVFFRETGIFIGTFEVLASSQVTSPKQFQTYLRPYIEKTVSILREITGVTPSFGGCGSNAKIWKDLLTMGITSFGIDATDQIAEAKQVLGSQAALCGNIDPTLSLTGSPEEIRQAIYDCLDIVSDSPKGFSLGLGGGTAAFGAPIENLRAYAQWAKQYGRGAQMGKRCRGLAQ